MFIINASIFNPKWLIKYGIKSRIPLNTKVTVIIDYIDF